MPAFFLIKRTEHQHLTRFRKTCLWENFHLPFCNMPLTTTYIPPHHMWSSHLSALLFWAPTVFYKLHTSQNSGQDDTMPQCLPQLPSHGLIALHLLHGAAVTASEQFCLKWFLQSRIKDKFPNVLRRLLLVTSLDVNICCALYNIIDHHFLL